MSYSLRQSASRLEVTWNGPRVRYATPIYPLSLTGLFLGISTTKHLGLTLASGSSNEKSRVTRRIRNWVPDMHTSLRGTRIASTSVASPINKRSVVTLFFVAHKTDAPNVQMGTCSGLSTLDHANSKYSKGYATTGVVCATCRHEFILPEGVGPLQKGERLVYGSMLFICV